MKNITTILLLMVLSVRFACASFYADYEDFSGFINGAALSSNDWTSVGVVVTNDINIGATNDWAAYFGEGSIATNTVSETSPSPSRVWTDFRIRPALGSQPGGDVTNGVQVVFFFDDNGFIQYWNTTEWITASTDIFGTDVTVMTNGGWYRVSVFQDYGVAGGTYAILLDDVVIAQDVPFVNDSTDYQLFTVDNRNNEAYLDLVRIHNSVPTWLVKNNNASLNDMADAEELNTNGYVARALIVDATPPVVQPRFDEIADALAVYREGDTLTVSNGSYTAITVTTNITLNGSGFTVAAITVADGATLTLPYNVEVTGDVTVAAGGTLIAQGTLGADNATIAGTLNVSGALALSGALGVSGTLTAGNSVNADSADISNLATIDGFLTVTSNLAVAGTLNMNAAASAATAAVSGTINIGNNTLTVTGLVDMTGTGNIQIGASGTLDAGDIDMLSGTQIVSLGGELDTTLLPLTGEFTINGVNWKPAAVVAPQSLPFTDDFERYANGQAVTNLQMFGWTANAASVVVTNAAQAAGSQSVILPDGTELSLSIDGNGQTKVWTDFYIRPALGEAPDIADAADKGFSSYVDAAGNLNAAIVEAGSTIWAPLSAKASWGAGVTEFTADSFTNQFSNSAFTRVSVFQDYEAGKFSVFIGTTNLVAEAQQFPGTHNEYSKFMVANSGNDAYLDEMRVLATLPFDPGDPTVDINNNGLDDRAEIHWYGDLTTYVKIQGSLFRFM